MYKQQYKKLEQDVYDSLYNKILVSGIESKHGSHSCIPVEVEDYTELAIIDGGLKFLDHNGYHYSIDCDVTLEDLIGILED